MKTEYRKIDHPIPPLYDEKSRILILGSFPSVKSREVCFFYGHPQNRFWRVMTQVLGWPRVPETVEEKSALLHASHVAIWDTIASCEIKGSSDASIRAVVANDLTPILRTASIRQIFCNGMTSYNLYMKYLAPVTGRVAVKLPSTSPANAAWSVEKLADAWQVVRVACMGSAEEEPDRP